MDKVTRLFRSIKPRIIDIDYKQILYKYNYLKELFKKKNKENEFRIVVENFEELVKEYNSK